MTHEEIIAMAREEGLSFVPDANSPLARIVRKAVDKEREGIMELISNKAGTDDFDQSTCMYLVNEIRALDQKEGA